MFDIAQYPIAIPIVAWFVCCASAWWYNRSQAAAPSPRKFPIGHCARASGIRTIAEENDATCGRERCAPSCARGNSQSDAGGQLDCSGNLQAERLCVDATRRKGKVAFIGEGNHELSVRISPDLIRKG